MKRHRFFNQLSLLFSIVLFITGITGSAFAGSNDTVTIALDIDPTTVNVLETKIGIDIVMQHMHESLLASEPVTGDLEPLLADKISIMPNGKDIKVTIGKNHIFHTGDPLTTEDIKWSYEQAVSPEFAHLVSASLEEIESIEILDNYTIIFHYYEPFAPWRENMWLGIASKKYFEKVGIEKFRKEPVGSGPFKFVSRSIGESVVMDAFDGYTYWDNAYNKDQTKIIKYKVAKKKVDFKTLKFVSVRDPITRIAMLEAGEADLAYNLLPHDAKRLGMNKSIKIKKSSNVPSFFALATKPLLYPIMADLKFQAALSHAINRQEIVDKVFLGEGYPMYMYASRSELGYDPNFKIKFDPERARQLIKESSYKPGQPIILTFTNAVPSSEIIAPIIQKYLKDVGVSIQLQQLEAGVQATYSRTKDRREGHMTLYAWAGGRDPQTRIILTVPSDSSYTSYPGRPSKDILDKLCMEQAKQMDKNKRLEILNKIHAILKKEPSSVPLYGLNQIYGMRTRIDYTWTPKSAFPFNLTRIKIMKNK